MLAQKLVIGFASRIVSQIVSMIAGIVVARIAGPTVLGTVAFGMSFVSMFQFVADLGIGSAHVKLISEGRDLGRCNATFAVAKSILTILFFFTVVGLIVTQFVFFPKTFETQEHLTVVAIWLVSVVVSQLSLIPVSTFIALTEQAKQDVPAFLQQLLTQGLRVGVVALGAGAIGLSLVQLLGVVLLTIVYFRMFRAYPRTSFDASLVRRYLGIGLPITVIGFSSTLLEYVDRVMLQYFSNSSEVGFYSAALGFSGALKTIGITVGLLFFPVLSSAYAKADYVAINTVLIKFERFSYIFLMPLVIVGVIMSGALVRLVLGPTFEPSARILGVLLMGTFFFVVNVPYGNLIAAMNRFGLLAGLYFANLVFFGLVNGVLLSELPTGSKAMATAIATACSAFVLGYSFRVCVQRLTKRIGVWQHRKFLIFGVVGGTIAHHFSTALEFVGPFVGLLLFSFLFCTTTFGFFYLARWATKDDIRLLGEIFNVKRAGRYIRSEFSKV